jgi:SAM-dependent methyltransferase
MLQFSLEQARLPIGRLPDIKEANNMPNMNDIPDAFSAALWRIYRRPDQITPWVNGGNLPWDEPEFASRMLREHLDDSHGAASRQEADRVLQLDWLWSHLALKQGARLLDITCGPGLYALSFAARGCRVTGIDFSPAAIAHARDQARRQSLEEYCTFVEQDVRQVKPEEGAYDAAIFLYGQLAVFEKSEAQALLGSAARALRPGGALCIELLNQDKVDKSKSSWWFTGQSGLWGEAPFLHLGERFWLEEEKISVERFHTLHLETGRLEEIILCDQTYSGAEMVEMLVSTGFKEVDVFPAWGGLPLDDRDEWQVYLAHR